MDEQTARLLNENILELERAVSEGRAARETRWALLKAHAHRIDFAEQQRGIVEEKRSRLRLRENSRSGVLLIHGSNGSPADMAKMAEALHGAGSTVFSVRLPGHGISKVDLNSLSWRACLEEVRIAYRTLVSACPQTYVVGLSFGAALALQIEETPQPAAIVLISPAIYPRLSFWQRLLTRLGLDRFAWLKSRLGWDAELLAAMSSARSTKWWRETPIFAAMAEDDTKVDPEGLGWLKKHTRSKKSAGVRYDDGGHMFLKGPRRQAFQAAVLDFLKQN